FYVKDGTRAYLHLAECLAARPEIAGQAFNFSADTPIRVLDLVDRILHLMYSPLPPCVPGEARHEIRHQYLSSAKARRTLSWAPPRGDRLVRRLPRRQGPRPRPRGLTR